MLSLPWNERYAKELSIACTCFAAANDKKDFPVAAIAITVSIGSIIVILCGYLFWKLLAKHRGNYSNEIFEKTN